jgi:hypothetical protein
MGHQRDPELLPNPTAKAFYQTSGYHQPRLWARFRYRRLPEPPDFAVAVQEELDERRAAAARIRTVALKIRTAQMFARFEAEAADRHARRKQEERARRIHADAASGRKESRKDQPACAEPRGHLATPTFVNTVDAGCGRPDPSAREEAGADVADTVFGSVHYRDSGIR